MHHSQVESMFGAVAPRPVADGLGAQVHGLHQPVVDSQVEVIQDALFVSSQHPCEVTQGFESAVCGPPEPTFEVPCRPASPFVRPEICEEFFEKVGPDDLEVEIEQFSEPDGLPVGEVPGVLEPEISGYFSARALASILRTLSTASRIWRMMWNLSKTMTASPQYSWMTSM